jgi:hypothetical protein
MQRDYFVLMRARSQQHPLLAWDQDYLSFLKPRRIELHEPVKLKLGEPVPPKPLMVDHHSLPAPVVSPRLKEMLAPLELHGVQWIPADVRVDDGDVRRYWLMHMWRQIRCMDRGRSDFAAPPSGLFLLSLDRLVLDEAVLGAIPLQERLVFLLEEDTVHLFHRSVVDRVMSLTPPPEGLRFIPVPDWNDSASFR